MSWFKAYLNVYRHPKTLGLMDALTISHNEAAGALLGLWAFVYEHNPDGSLEDLSPQVLARAVRFEYRADEFIEALIALRLVDVDQNGRLVRLHNAERYSENFRRAERQRERRAGGRNKRLRRVK